MQKINVCKEMADVFTELQDSYFFYPNTSVTNNQEVIWYQPVLWHVFTSVIDKNKKLCIEIGKSIPHCGLVLNYEKTCWSCIYLFFDYSTELMPGPQKIRYFRFLKKWLFKEKIVAVQHFCWRNMTDLVIYFIGNA